jgi:hypothetical protein
METVFLSFGAVPVREKGSTFSCLFFNGQIGGGNQCSQGLYNCQIWRPFIIPKPRLLDRNHLIIGLRRVLDGTGHQNLEE